MKKTTSIILTVSLFFMLLIPSTTIYGAVKAYEKSEVSGVSLNKNSLTLTIGESYNIIATNKNLIWTSSDNSIAIVNKYGKITAVSTGSAVIIATTVDNSFTAKCTVTVVSENILLHYEFNDDLSKTTIKDSSAYDNDGIIKGSGATINNGELILPGGTNGAYVELPKGMFDKKDTLTISMWLKNDTGKGNYSAMFFGTTESYPSQYWLFNPCNPSGLFKSVITNSIDKSSPWNTEYGISPTNTSQGVLGSKTDNNWAFYTTVIEPTKITAYYNGIKIGTAAVSRTVSQLGSELVSYIGRSSYSDPYLKGSIRDVKVYSSALTETEIKDDNVKTILERDKSLLSLTDTSVVSDIELPSSGASGSTITWKSSNTMYITDDGIVTRPENGKGDANVTMTATINKDGLKLIKEFNILVLENSQEKDLSYLNNIAENFGIGITYVTEDLELPSTKGNVSISWKSSDETLVSATGKVTRPEEGDQNVTLTACLEFGLAKVEKSFDVTVAEKTYGYLLSYVLSGNTDRTDCLHMAYSQDGQSYTALNDNRGIRYTSNGVKKMGSPVIFRKVDGTYGLIASDDNNSSYIIVMDSDDLITYKNETYVEVNNQGINVKDPFCYFDVEVNAYRIDFIGSDGNSYTTTTEDFITFTDLEKTIYAKADVTANIPTDAMEPGVFEVTKSEYDRVVEKYSRITNTGIKSIPNMEVKTGNTFELPEKVTAEYNDGSTKDMGVIWNQDELNSVDISKAGTYTITGVVQQQIYTSPLIEERADPDVILGSDGYYYFTASYPTYGDKDKEGYDRIILRRSTTIEGLESAEEITIWDESTSNESFRYIWAPEIHNINGKWYVFYTASTSPSNVWGIVPHILACEGDGDPYKPENWVEKGRVKPANGDTESFTHFSLDMTYFECNNKHYVAWAEKPNGISNIYMATIDPSEPWQLTSNAIQLTTPEYAWEWKDSTKVNEGPAVLKHDGKVFLCYSASAVDESYCIGVLSADESDDLMKISSWTKNAYPILSSDDLSGEYGPGHNSFTVDAYGNDVIVYHSRPVECYNNTCEYANSSDLNDPHRHARAKNVNFAVDGSPILNMTYDEELADENKNVAVILNISGDSLTYEVPETVDILKNDDILTAELLNEDGSKFTTDAAVKYEWYRDDELVEEENSTTYKLSDDDKGTNINVKVPQYGLTSDYIYIYIDDDNGSKITYKNVPDGAYDFSRKLEKGLNSLTVDNNTKADNILDAVKPYVEATTSSAVELSMEDYNVDEATYEKSGNITGEIVIDCDEYTSEYGFSLDISMLSSGGAYDFSKAVNKGLKSIIAYNDTESDDILDAVRPYVEATTSSAVELSMEDYNLDEATYEKEGSITGEILINCDDYDSSYEFNLKIAILVDSNEVDKSKLIEFYNAYKNKTKGRYTDYTWNIFVLALKNAQVEINREDSSQKEIEDVYKQLKSAIDGLKLKKKSNHSSESKDSSSSSSTSIDGENVKSENEETKNLPKLEWQLVNGKWYIINNANGTKITGWYNDNGIWYYLNEDGSMAIEWIKDNYGKWYYLNQNGSMATGWILDRDGKWYYLNNLGVMQIGWIKDNYDKWYYLKENGAMAHDEYIDEYYVDSNGVWIELA